MGLMDSRMLKYTWSIKFMLRKISLQKKDSGHIDSGPWDRRVLMKMISFSARIVDKVYVINISLRVLLVCEHWRARKGDIWTMIVIYYRYNRGAQFVFQ